MKILVVDDEKNLRQVLAIELSADGDEVDAAEDGLKALELLEKTEYDVVLLDLNMPRMGGIDVLKKIRALDTPRGSDHPDREHDHLRCGRGHEARSL